MNNKNTGSDLSGCSRGLACGQRANLIAVTLANALAEGKTADQLEFLSSVLQLVLCLGCMVYLKTRKRVISPASHK